MFSFRVITPETESRAENLDESLKGRKFKRQQVEQMKRAGRREPAPPGEQRR